jgi:hypothetical protein
VTSISSINRYQYNICTLCNFSASWNTGAQNQEIIFCIPAGGWYTPDPTNSGGCGANVSSIGDVVSKTQQLAATPNWNGGKGYIFIDIAYQVTCIFGASNCAPSPAQLQGVKCAAWTILQNYASIFPAGLVNPANPLVTGSSAGGHLAWMLANTPDTAFTPSCPVSAPTVEPLYRGAIGSVPWSNIDPVGNSGYDGYANAIVNASSVKATISGTSMTWTSGSQDFTNLIAGQSVGLGAGTDAYPLLGACADNHHCTFAATPTEQGTGITVSTCQGQSDGQCNGISALINAVNGLYNCGTTNQYNLATCRANGAGSDPHDFTVQSNYALLRQPFLMLAGGIDNLIVAGNTGCPSTACVATWGTGGGGHVTQFVADYAALSPPIHWPVVISPTLGHQGDLANGVTSIWWQYMANFLTPPPSALLISQNWLHMAARFLFPIRPLHWWLA